jgi:uncharacterized RDD family membrane protein YckC
VSEDPLEYAGFWLRVGAAIIDTIIIMVVTLPPLVWIYGWAYFDSGAWISGPAEFIISWVLPAVALILFWNFRQVTPGKMAYSMRIVDAKTGQSPTTKQNIIRYLGYFISTIPLCSGIFWVVFDRRKRGWHDMLANTVVDRDKDRSTSPVKFE